MQHIVEFAFSSFQKWGHIDPNRSGIGLNCLVTSCRSIVIADINDCLSNPCEFGTCTDEVNQYSCRCIPGYTGERCESGRLQTSHLHLQHTIRNALQHASNDLAFINNYYLFNKVHRSQLIELAIK